MEKVFKVADIRDLEQKVALGEMSYSRMVEVLNEMAEEYYSKVKKLNEPAVSVVREPLASGAVCPHFDTCQNGGKNKHCDLQTFKEIDCFMGTD